MMFERLSVYNCPVVVCRNFSVHVDDTSCVHAAYLADLLQSLSSGYVQHVTTATHTAGRILDLVIARSDTDITHNAIIITVGGFISDHALVRFTVRVRKPINPPQSVSCRAWKRFKRDVFESDLAASEPCSNLEQLSNKSADDLAVMYRDVMTQLLDKHCLVVEVRHRVRPVTHHGLALSVVMLGVK